MKKGLKITWIILFSLFVVIAAALIVVPRVIPSYIEKHSQALMGRQIELGKVRLNVFTMTLRITDFVLYESNKENVFVSFDEYNVNLALLPTLSGHYTISSMLLDNLKVHVETDGDAFNFDDLIVEADTSAIVKGEVENEDIEQARFTLNNIELRKSSIHYYDRKNNIRHDISNIGFVLPHFSWDNTASSEMGLTFTFEPQGLLQLNAKVDYTRRRYKIQAQIIDLALAPFSVYLESMLASQGIEGLLNNTIYVNGSIENTDDIVISGSVELNDFLIKDEKGAPIFAHNHLKIDLDSIDLQHNYFGVRKIFMSEPQVYAALYDTHTNFDQLLSPMTKTASDSLAEEATPTDSTVDAIVFFKIDTFLMEDGAVYFTDHTLNRPFTYNIAAIYALAKDITPKAETVPIAYHLKLNNAARLNGNAEWSMLEAHTMSYAGQLKGLDLTSFSPYSEYYIARSIKRGNFSFKGNAKMTATAFNAENAIRINDIELGKKTKDKAKINIPVNLALGILKDKNGDVIIDVPMHGNPADPEFNIGKIIGKTLSNFILKIASTPFMIVGDIAGVDPERLKEIPLQLASSELADREKKTLGQIALALKEKPELAFHFILEMPTKIEKEATAIHKVKKDFLMDQGISEKAMDEALQRLNNKNDSLLIYAASVLGDSSVVNFTEQCVAIVGDEALKKSLQLLELKRHANLEAYLLNELQVDPESFDIHTMDNKNHLVTIKKPRYRVEVSVK